MLVNNHEQDTNILFHCGNMIKLYFWILVEDRHIRLAQTNTMILEVICIIKVDIIF